MSYRGIFCAAAAFAIAFFTDPAYSQDAKVDAGLLRTPDVSEDKVVFIYDRDVWMVPKEGGQAVPLSSPAGMEQFPRFSPDGSKVAYAAAYDGNIDIYEMPVSGGLPRRLSYMPQGAFMVDYAPDGRVVFGSSYQLGRGTMNLYYASPTAGLPEPLPRFEAMFASFSADGQWAAIDPSYIEFQNWNRYQGGTASDIWLVNLSDLQSRKLTDWPGTDTQPMLHADKIYYLSDAGPEHRRNIWVCGLDGIGKRQITSFRDFETKWPSIGPSDIVMENGGKLWLLDLATEELKQVEVSLPGDRLRLMKRSVDVTPYIFEISVSPQAKRVAVNARGDIWTVPAEEGFNQNLTRTDGIFERDPVWSPDSKWIAYFSDRSGEYELYMRPSDGSG
jgi:tricorn protease